MAKRIVLNIFKYLGIAKSTKVTQNVKNFKEVPKSKLKQLYYGSLKKDGISGLLVVKDGEAKCFTRTGLLMTNAEVVTDNGAIIMPNGVYCGEVTSKYPCHLEALGGALNPNRNTPLDSEQEKMVEQLEFWVFDGVTIAEFTAGLSPRPFEERYAELVSTFQFMKGSGTDANMVPRDWHLLEQKLVKIEDVQAFADALTEQEEEGAVFKLPEESWVAGHKGYRAFKIVCGIHLDLVCDGVVWGTPGSKADGLLFALSFKHKGLPFNAGTGKGWSYPNLKKLTFLYKQCAGSVVGQLWHVSGLKESSLGVIRLPKFNEIRIDKEVADE